jgi:pimeloyl-ACP methyl ester carboxylesterase
MTALPVVVLTGQLLTNDFWQPLASVLGEHVQYADNGRDESIAGMATRALDAAPVKFSLVAHAMGGFVAFEILRRAPERVANVALLSTLAPADTPAQTERRLRYARLVEEGRFDQVVEERIPILLHKDRRTDAVLLERVRRMAKVTGADRFLKQQRAIMTREDSRPGLVNIHCPALTVAGAEDDIATSAYQAEIHAAIPGARRETLPHCGHLVTLEREDLLAPLIKTWLA